MRSDPLPEFTGPLGLFLLLILLVISIYWLLFPIFVYSKLDKILAALERVAKAVALVGVQAAGQAASIGPAGISLPPVPGSETYHVAVGSEVSGPHTLEQVQALAAKGTISAETWILRQGSPHWQRFDQVFDRT